MPINRRMWSGVGAAAMLAGALTVVAPQNAAAFTLIEKTLGFAPVELSTFGQTAKVCATNFGDGSVDVAMMIVDATNTSNVLMSGTPTIAAGGIACIQYTNSASVTGAAADPTAVEISALIGLLRKGSPSAFSNLVASLTVQDTTPQNNQLNRVVLAPLLLPAVQLPTPAR